MEWERTEVFAPKAMCFGSTYPVYDYTYDGVMRSIEQSLERAGLDSFDILMVHDLDVRTHGSWAAFLEMTEIFFTKRGYDALHKLKEEGVTRAIGSGQNDIECSKILAKRADFDIFLIAGRYTLLEQEPLNVFLPLCERRDIGVVIGGPYNSGILATGPVPGAHYNYSAAQPPVVERVARIQSICANHGVRLIEAAFHFPLPHRQVLSVIPGAAGVEQMKQNSHIAATPPPDALWDELKAADLLHEKAPTTSGRVR